MSSKLIMSFHQLFLSSFENVVLTKSFWKLVHPSLDWVVLNPGEMREFVASIADVSSLYMNVHSRS